MTRRSRNPAAWRKLREGFRRLVNEHGAKFVARAIPADRATVYRMLRSDHEPSLAVREGVRRLVEGDDAAPQLQARRDHREHQ